jgi:hypothetical protein
LLKKGWHHNPWERRGSIYQQQAAFTCAMIIAYGRPFTKSRGWPPFPPALRRYDALEQALHARLIGLRHKVFAHSDSEGYKIRPWRSKDFSTTIVGAPVLKVTRQDAELLQGMTAKLIAAIDQEMKAILASA